MHSKEALKRLDNPLNKAKPMEEHIAHFKSRLLERFNIDITTGEYYDLVANISKGKSIYQLSASSGLHSMMIRDVEVWVIYGKSQDIVPARLKTALIPYKELVVPNCLTHIYDNKSFTARVGTMINEIKEISKLINLNDKKSFFTQYTHIHPFLKSISVKYKMHNDAWDLNFIRGVIKYVIINDGTSTDEKLFE